MGLDIKCTLKKGKTILKVDATVVPEGVDVSRIETVVAKQVRAMIGHMAAEPESVIIVELKRG